MATFQFTWFDYLIFCSMLSFSVLIGLYFGCRANKSKEDYLLGRNTNVVVVAASLVASNIAGLSIVGVPADIYQFGAIYLWCPVSYIISVLIAVHITMPVLLNIESNSVFEYLELRFNRKIRILGSAFTIFNMALTNPVIIYVPSITLAQLTGLSSTMIMVVSCLICVFYTTLGGLNAVIWTDTLQFTVMVASLIAVLIMGITTSGGLSEVWAESVKGERLDILKFNLDFTERDTIWVIILGYTCVALINVAAGQGLFQRLKSVKSNVRAKKTLWLYNVGITTSFVVTTLIGLSIYARYSLCDPLLNKDILNYDQIVAYYVMDIGGYIVGLPGLFIAGLYGAGLSTLSTNLNCSAAIIYSDFLIRFITTGTKKKNEDLILKLIVIIVGGLCIIIAFLIQYLGGIVQIVLIIMGISGAPLSAIFILGMVFPKSNSTGALTGSIAAAALTLWMALGNMYYQKKGYVDVHRPLSIENCIGSNVTVLSNTIFTTEENPFILYRVSYFYYAPIALLVTFIVGYLSSLITHKKTDIVRPELITPLFRFLIPQVKSQDSQLYTSIDKSLNITMTELEENDNN